MTKYPPASYAEIELLLAQGISPQEIAETLPRSLGNLRHAMWLFQLRRAKPYRKLAAIRGQAVGNVRPSGESVRV